MGHAKPVLLSVTATLAFCLVGHLAYNRYMLAPTTLSQGHEPRQDVEGPSSATAPTRAAEKNCEALLRALAEARAAETSKECTPVSPSLTEGAAADGGTTEAERVREQVDRYLKANVEALEEEFFNEKVDPEWAQKTEEGARRAVAATTRGMRLDEVTCRSTFCRARLKHVDPSMRENDLMDLTLAPELSGQMLPYAPAGEEQTTVVYFARQGHILSGTSSGPTPSSPPNADGPVEGPPGG
jgi:hypothetical protein